MNFAKLKESLAFSLRHPRLRASIYLSISSTLLAIIICISYWWPAVHLKNNLINEINELRLSISKAEHNIQLEQAVEVANQQLALVERKLNVSTTQADLIQNISAMARRHNVQIDSETYEEGKNKDGYERLAHEITVHAGYVELRAFIDDVQQMPTLTVIQEAIVSRSSNSKDIRAQLSIVTYRRTPDLVK